MRKQVFRILTTLFALLVLVGTLTAQSDMNTATVTISADGVSTPETLSAGLVQLTFENTNEAPFIPIFAQLSDGVTPDAVMEALFTEDMSIVTQLILKGGPGVMPGQSSEMTIMLEAGTYMLMNVGAEMPQVAQFVVDEGDDTMIETPTEDVNIVMVDFGYGVPLTIAAGENLWHIQNVGDQWHEMAIAPIEPGTAVEDIRAMLAEEAETGEPMLQQFPVLMPLNSGEETWITVDLEPGSYVLVCNLPDIMEGSEGHIHHELGMIQLVTVANTLTYEDADGFFTVVYPAEMIVRPDLAAEFGLPFPSVAFGDSEQTMDMSMAAEVLEDGAWGIGIIFVPGGMFTQMGLPEDATLLDKAIAFSAPEPENAEGYTMGEAMDVTLEDGTPAVQIEGNGETEDNLIIFFEATDDVYALVPLLTAVDGRTDEMIADWMDTVNSINFTGTADDVMASLGG